MPAQIVSGFEQWLMQWKPDNISGMGLILLGMMGVYLLLVRYLIPLYRDKILPEQQAVKRLRLQAQIDNDKLKIQADIERDKRNTEVLSGIRDALVEMKQLSAQLVALNQRQEDALEQGLKNLAARLDQTLPGKLGMAGPA